MTASNKSVLAAWPDSWLTLSHGLRKGRYTDPEFARLERDRLWYQVWQFAARLDEIPQVGDFTTYQIFDQSVMIVRTADDAVKAYFNFCPHRGTTLSDGCGHFEGGDIICPFHGWKWDLEGNIQFIMERQEFHSGQLKDEDVGLREVHCQVFEGFVFISLAREPQPFDEFIAPVRGYLESLALGKMHYRWWKSVIGPCNWKVAQEAFHETFHVATTHPQLDEPGRQVVFEGRSPIGTVMTHTNVKYEVFDNGHGRFFSDRTPISSRKENPSEEELEGMIDHMAHLVEELDTMVIKRDLDVAKSLRGVPVPAGSTYGAELIKAIYADAAAENRPMPEPTPENASMWGGEVFVFPNLLILPNLGNTMIYRIRPNGLDPDSCIFEILGTTTYAADKPVPRAEVVQVTDPSDPEQLPLIPRQDFSNVPRVQIGLHSLGCRQVWLADRNEKIILNMHRELDRYLQAPNESSTNNNN